MPRRILAVDDEIHMLRLLERLIRERTSYQLVTTSNSLEVPGVLERERFDVIVTDLKMPGLDGMDILRWVTDNQRSEEVIIITAFGSPDTLREAMTAGACDHISKPFRQEVFLFALHRAMRLVELKRELARLTDALELKPFDAAMKALKREYILGMVARFGGDIRATAKASGLTEEDIVFALGDQAPGNL